MYFRTYACVILAKLARQHKYYFCDAGAKRQGAKKYLCGKQPVFKYANFAQVLTDVHRV